MSLKKQNKARNSPKSSTFSMVQIYLNKGKKAVRVLRKTGRIAALIMTKKTIIYINVGYSLPIPTIYRSV